MRIGKKTGQANIMEYILLTFFIVLIIAVLMLFISGWLVSTSMSKQSDYEYRRALFLTKLIANSPELNREGYPEGAMLEDSKLTTITCEQVRKMFWPDIFMKIKIPGKNTDCTWASYVNDYSNCGLWYFCEYDKICGKWGLCAANKEKILFETPVNIYRKMSDKVDIGILTVGFAEPYPPYEPYIITQYHPNFTISAYNKSRANMRINGLNMSVCFEDWMDWDWNDMCLKINISGDTMTIEKYGISTGALDETHIKLRFEHETKIDFFDGTATTTLIGTFFDLVLWYDIRHSIYTKTITIIG